MCKADTVNTAAVPPTSRSSLRLLLSLPSYEGETSGQGPDAGSAVFTGLFFILFLVAAERLLNQWFAAHQDLHPLLEEELHRRILARHIGVDTLACTICAYLGFSSMHTYKDFWAHYMAKGGKGAFVRANYLNRVLTYDPASYRICLFFFAYQVKNLYDTIIFDDGIVFIFHHVFSAITAYGCMGPKVCNYYPFFFVGLSEVSTAILCLLANFDEQHGVIGLGEAFPIVKMVLAGIFVVTFLICRIITWPVLSYHFLDDILLTLRNHGDDPRVHVRKGWFRFFMISNGSLTLLQIAWLGEIFYTVHKEAVALGFL